MPTPLNRKPVTAAWIVRERKRLGLKPRDLVERLAAQGLVVTEATVKVWEANGDRRPAPENLEGLERIFGSSAPSLDAPAQDQADLASAIREQARAIELQADRIGALTLEIRFAALSVLGSQEGSATLLADLVRLSSEGKLDELAPLLRNEPER